MRNALLFVVPITTSLFLVVLCAFYLYESVDLSVLNRQFDLHLCIGHHVHLYLRFLFVRPHTQLYDFIVHF